MSDNGAALWSGDADMHADCNSKSKNKNNRYALKRINCSDREVLQACRREAGVHRSLPRHDNLMELLGLKFERDESFNHSRGNASEEYNLCYMLFPLVEKSLRGEIQDRHLLQDARSATFLKRNTFSIKEILTMFAGILDGIATMHQHNFSHRDVKIENILLRQNRTSYRDERHRSISAVRNACYTPVLMDFGSAGPLSIQINARNAVLSAIETAAQHTTLSYRPPELFEGGLRHDPAGKDTLHYGKVDVWSLGCVLFGMMHGCSPFEMEFVRTTDHRYDANLMDGVRIVECTQLRVLSEMPYPPWASSRDNGHTGFVKDAHHGRYPLALYDFVRFMVCHDRKARPDVQQVKARFVELYLGLTGERWEDGNRVHSKEKRGEDEFDSLIASREFV